MASAIRCAETTSASKATPNSCNANPAALITGQSESEPITIPTRGCWLSSGIGISHQVGRGVQRPLPCFIKIISEGVDMAHLATGTYLLAVQLHAQSPVSGKTVQQGRRQVLDASAEDIGHDGPRLFAAGSAERQVEDRAQVVLELRGVSTVDRPVAGVVRSH